MIYEYLSCAVLEVIIKIEKSQNLHLLRSNLILCHLYTVNIAKFISIAVHKELNFSCRNFATLICSSCMLFCFTFFAISVYLFNIFLHANKKVSSIQSSLHASANHLIFYMFPVSFAMGLKLLELK